MKIAFAIDFLLERNESVLFLELLLAGFPDATIYTLAHAPGKILGRIEYHTIISSQLSRLVKSKQDLKRFAWMVPSAVKGLKVDPSIDKMIILSSGWAHCFETSDHTERFVWLSHLSSETKLTGIRKIFSLYHQQVQMTPLRTEKNLAFSHEQLAREFRPDPKIIRPCFKTDDFFVLEDERHPGVYPYHLVILNGAKQDWVRDLVKVAINKNSKLKFVGPDEDYQDLKGHPLLEFIGDHCGATVAALSQEARAVWCLSDSYFPSAALGALACGRPAVLHDAKATREVFPEGAGWYFAHSPSEVFDQVEDQYLSVDKKLLRRQGLKFNERLFKNQFRSWAKLIVEKD
jgi:hypothetical protein